MPLARGKKNKEEADRAFHAMMSRKPTSRPRAARASLGEVRDAYIESVKARLRPTTIRQYTWVLGAFVEHLGESTPADEVGEADILRWLSRLSIDRSGMAAYSKIVKSMFSKAARWRMIPDNRAAGLQIRHTQKQRLVPTREQAQRIIGEASGATKTLVLFLWATGARPSEVASLQVEHLRRGEAGWHATLESKTSGATGKARTIRLPASMTPEVDRLAGDRTKGPLLLRANGRPWNIHAMSRALARLRRKLGYGLECCPGSFRHLWITDMLEAGVPIATVAELAGNSPAVISKHYSRLRQRTAHLDEAANKVR
jgi:integrase